MDTVWLESLLALLEHGSFTAAAQAQHISQPAFSRRIRSLETWAGGELVDRSTYPAALTPAGAKVRTMAVEAVSGLAAVRDEVRGRQLRPHEAVRVSTSHILATYYFPNWWRAVSGDADLIPCVLAPLNTLEAYDSLLHGEADFLLAYADPSYPLEIDHSELQWCIMARDHLSPYSRVTGGVPLFLLPGTAKEPIPFVTYGSHSFLGRVTDRILDGRQRYLRPVAQTDLSAALGMLVRGGAGLGWLPELLTREAGEGGDIALVHRSDWSAELEIRLYRGRREGSSRFAQMIWERACELAKTRR